MSSGIETSAVELNVSLHLSLQALHLDADLYAYRLTTGVKGPLPVQLSARFAEATQEGLCTKEALDDFRSGKVAGLRRADISLVHPEFLALAATLGFNQAWQQLDKQKISVVRNDEAFSLFTANDGFVEHLVYLDLSSDTLKDRHGRALPVSILFDYTQGLMHNGAYDLEKAVAILRHDPRVVFANPKQPIQEIPYYNKGTHRTHTLSFRFNPSLEDAQRMWEQQLSYQRKFPSTMARQAIFDLDMLGLRRAGAAKFPEFWQNDEDVQ